MTDSFGEMITGRLRLRPLGPGDVEDLTVLHSDPQVMQGRTGLAVAEPRTETEAWLERQRTKRRRIRRACREQAGGRQRPDRDHLCGSK